MRLSPAVALIALLALPAGAAADGPAREQEPVVLTGGQLGDWAVPANQTARPSRCAQPSPVGRRPRAPRR